MLLNRLRLSSMLNHSLHVLLQHGSKRDSTVSQHQANKHFSLYYGAFIFVEVIDAFIGKVKLKIVAAELHSIVCHFDM